MKNPYTHLLVGLKVRVINAHPYLGINDKGKVGRVVSATEDGQLIIKFRGLKRKVLGFTSSEVERAE